MSILNSKKRVVKGVSIRTRLLTDEVFSNLVSGKEKGLSAEVMCRNSGIKPNTLENWLSDPYPVGAVKRLQKAFAELEGVSFNSYQSELRRLAHEQATTGRIEEKETRTVTRSFTGAEYEAIQKLDETERVETIRAKEITIKHVVIRQEIPPDGRLAFRLWQVMEKDEENKDTSGDSS